METGGIYLERVYQELKEIFWAGVDRVNPLNMVKNHVKLSNERLVVTTETDKVELDLNDFDEIVVVGAGKATAKMALAIEEILGDRISRGLISVKKGHTESLNFIKTVEAGHPVPDENSVRAAKEIAKLCVSGGDRTLFINLISGGGSALLCYPFSSTNLSIGLEEKQKTTQLLLASGASIQEVNCIRKHISNIKGGRLARLMHPAVSLNLILSDVVGDRLDSIASGLTVPDETTYRDAMDILERYGIKDKVPAKVYEIIKAGCDGVISDTPKSGEGIFERVYNVLIGNNVTALLAAKKMAENLGYNTVVLSSRVIGDVRDAASFYLGIALDEAEYELLNKKPSCIIGGGETTVRLKGRGLGGRNQEMSLWFLKGLAENMTKGEDLLKRIYFLSAGTDGNDGPTDAAGAFASLGVLRRAGDLGIGIDEYLVNNDSYHFFERVGALLKTGPTNTNVCDIQVVIVR